MGDGLLLVINGKVYHHSIEKKSLNQSEGSIKTSLSQASNVVSSAFRLALLLFRQISFIMHRSYSYLGLSSSYVSFSLAVSHHLQFLLRLDNTRSAGGLAVVRKGLVTIDYVCFVPICVCVGSVTVVRICSQVWMIM